MGFSAFSIVSLIAFSNPLNSLFGWITRFFYEFFGNYGLAIIALTVLIRAALIPLNISSQKSMIKTQALSQKQAEIQRKYPNDKQKQQEEITKMMQENGAMNMGGCLLPFLQLVFIYPIFRIVSGPLRYLSSVSVENLNKMAQLAVDKGYMAESAMKNIENYDISLLEIFGNNSQFLRECIAKGYLKMSQVLNLDFLGLDLTKKPQWMPNKIMDDPKTYLPLLAIPALVIITTLIQMKLSNVLRPDYKEQKLAKQRAKKNAAMAGQAPTDQAEMTAKIMGWMMPVLMIMFTFGSPAAMGLYWIIGNIMMIITNIITYYLFTKPFALKKKELEEQKQAFLKGKRSDDKAIEDKSSKSNKKKKN